MECYQTCVDQGRKCTFSTSRLACSDCGKIKSAYHYNSNYCKKCPTKTDCKCAQQTCNKKHSKCWKKILAFFGYGESDERASKGSIGSEDIETQSHRSKSNASATQVSIHSQHLYEKSSKASLERQAEGGQDKIKDIEFDISDSQNEGAKSADNSKKDNLKPEQKAKPQAANKKEKSPKWTASNTSTASRGRRRKKKSQPISSSSSLSRKGLTSPKARKRSTSSEGSHKSGKSQSCSSSISSCSPIFKQYRHKYSFLKCASFSGTGYTNPHRSSSPPADTHIGERYSRCPHRSSYICSAPYTFITHEDCCNPFQEEVEEFETSPKRRKSSARRRSSASNCESMYSSTGSSGGRSLCNPKCPKINCKSKKCMSTGPSNRAYCQSSCLPHAKLPCRSQSFHSTLLKGPSPRAVCIPTCSPCCCPCTSPCGRSRCRQPKSSSPVTCPSRKARSCPRPCACPIKSACCSPPPCCKACCPRPSQNPCVRQNKRSSGGGCCKQNCPPSCTKGCCLPCPRQFQVLPYCPNLNSFRFYASLPKCIKGSHCPCPPEMCSCVKPKNKLSQKINSSMLASLCTPMCCSGFSTSYVKSKQGDAICQQLLNKYSFSKPISKCDVQLCTGSSFIPSTPSNRSSGCARNCCFSAGSFVHSMSGKPYGGGGGGCKSCLPNDGQAGVPKAAEPADNYTHSRKPSSPEDKRKKQEQTILFNSAPCNKEPRCEFFLAPYCLRKTGPRSPVREYMDKLNAKPIVIKSVHDDCSEKRQSHESDKSQKCEGKKQEVSKAKKKRKPKTRKQPAAPPTDENASALVGVKGGDDTTEEYPQLDNLGAFFQMQSKSAHESVSKTIEKSSNNNYSNDMNSSSAKPMKLQFTDRRSYSFSRSNSLGNSSYGYKASYGSYGSLNYRSRDRPEAGPYFPPTNFYQKSYAWRKEIENIYKEIETFRKRQPPNVNINALSTPAYMSSYYSRKRTLESSFYENISKAKLYDQLEKEIEERIQEIKKNKTFEVTSESSALRRRFTYPELMSEEVVSETLKMLKERQQQRSGEDSQQLKDSAHPSDVMLGSDKEAVNTNNGKCSANQKSVRAFKRIAPKSTQIGAKSTQIGAKSTQIGAKSTQISAKSTQISAKSTHIGAAKTAQSTAQKSCQSLVPKIAKACSRRTESAKRADEAKTGLPFRALNETVKNKPKEQVLSDLSSTNNSPDKNLFKPAQPLHGPLGDSFLHDKTPSGESNVDLPVHQSTLVMFQDLFYRFGEPSNVKMVNIEPSKVKVDHSEPSNVKVGHSEPSNVKIVNIEPSKVKVDHSEPSNMKVGHSEPVNMQVDHSEPSNVKVGHSEPVNVQVGHTELANLKEGHSEAVNVQAVHSELANVKVGHSELASIKTSPHKEGKFERYDLAEENISKNKAVEVLEELVLQDTTKLCCRDSYLCASANSSACNMTSGTSSTTITMVGSQSNHTNMSNLDLLPSDIRPLLVRNNSCDRRHKILAECKNYYDNMSSSTLGNSDSQLKTCSFKYQRVMSPHSPDTESLASLGKLKYIPDSESSLSLSSPRKNCNNGSCVDPAKSESSHMDVLQGSSVDPDSSTNPTPVSQVGLVKSNQSLSMFHKVDNSDTELIRSARNLYYSRLRTGQEGDGSLPLETKSEHVSEISKSLEGMAVPSHSTVCDPISDGMVDFIRHYGTPV